jgi:hypothetical protein
MVLSHRQPVQRQQEGLQRPPDRLHRRSDPHMTDDHRDFTDLDPAKLFPFVRERIPANPDAVLLPDSEKYIGHKA